MSPLSGLVNYSDDENSSSTSSDDEQKVSRPTKTEQEKIPIQRNDKFRATAVQSSTEPNEKIIQQSKDDLPRPTTPINVQTAAAPSLDSQASDYKRRLLAAIAPKPIEGVDNWGIPNEPNEPCDPERVERIAHFLSLKTSGHRLNHHLQRNKAFHNPRIYTKLVEFTEVDEIGSNFDKADFDPHGFSKELYIDGILETQKLLAEEKAAQQQSRTAVNFVPPQHQQQAKSAAPTLTEQQSAAMAQAMATAARVASRIAKPPGMTTVANATTAPANATTPEKRRSNWDDTSSRREKRR